MMTDEQFETLVSNIAPENVQAFLRARDTAQREALARVEAERDLLLQHNNGRIAEERDTAQAQLAEAVGLLRNIEYAQKYGWEDSDTEALQAFLARHAQGAQAGDELVAKAIYDADRSVFMSKREYAELHHTTKVRLLKMARAALATQPVVIKLPERRPIDQKDNFRRGCAHGFNACLIAVSRLNAVRGAEHE